MDIRVLGPLQVLQGDRDLTPKGPLQGGVFLRLLLDANEAVSAERLAEDLFEPHQPVKNAAASLQVHVSRLRKSLGAGECHSRDLIVTGRSGYSLRIDPEELDSWRFERQAAEAGVAVGARPDIAAKELESALALWRGPALADFAFASYTQNEIRRLEELRLVAVENLFEARFALGRARELVSELQALVGEYPFRERLWGQLMRSLYLDGRQTEALRTYQDLRRLLDEEVGLAPGPELQELEQALLRQDPSLHPGHFRSRQAASLAPSEPDPPELPHPLTRFVGRADARAELISRLGESRLVTLTGMAGVGKTRLALEVASAVAPSTPGGVWLVELAPLGDPALVVQAVASVIGVREEPGVALEKALAGTIGDRALLLVLDNCEHLLHACAELVWRLLGRCPNLRVLATSQEVLGIPGEALWPVPPLSVPAADIDDQVEQVAQHEAVQLFCDRARLVRPDFALDPDNSGAVATVCRRLDGLPLAIELAAATVAQLAVEEIAQLLDDRFSLLTGGTRWVATRHQTLLAAVEWSHARLSPEEQVLLRRLSVFAGGATLGAVEEVCAAKPLVVSDLFSLLSGLVAKSLVVADIAGGQARYRLLETIRHYASDRLLEAGEHRPVAESHSRWCVGLAERAEPELTGPDQMAWHDRLVIDQDNLRVGLAWATGERCAELALRLSSALTMFWWAPSQPEGRQWLERSLVVGGDAAVPLRAKALWGLGHTCLMLGDDVTAAAAASESLGLWRSLGDARGQARALLLLGQCALQDPRFGSPLQVLQESVSMAREAGDKWCLLLGLSVAGWAHLNRGELSLARPFFAEAVGLAGRDESAVEHGPGLIGLGHVALGCGDYAAGESLLNKAVTLCRRLNDGQGATASLCLLAELSASRGDHDGARPLLDEALDLAARISSPGQAAECLCLRGRVALDVGDLPGAQTSFEEARSVGDHAGFIVSHALLGLAQVDLCNGELAAARALLDTAFGEARDKGNVLGVANIMFGLAEWTRAAGDVELASAHHRWVLEVRSGVGNVPGVVSSLEALGSLSVIRDQPIHAIYLLAAADTLRARLGFARPVAQLARHEAEVSALRQSFAGEDFEMAWAEGAGLSLADAVACALGGDRRHRGDGDRV